MIGLRRVIYCFLALCLILAFFTNAVGASYFKDLYYPAAYTYSLDTAPALTDCTPPGMVMTELSGVDYIVMARGDTFNVSLMETDPHLNWELIGAEGAQYAGNSLIETYPVRHLFRLKADSSSAIWFKMIDDRNGEALKTFEFGLVVEPPVSGLGWPIFSPDMAPSFGWPVMLKF